MLEGKEKGLEEANSSPKYELSVQPDQMIEFRNPGEIMATNNIAKVSCVYCCSDLQAIGRVNSEASDWLRWLPAHPHQLDDQLHLVARRLLQRGTPYSATNTQENEKTVCTSEYKPLLP